MNFYGFDGIDIDWEFPVWSSDSKKTDRAQLGNLLEELHEAYKLSAKLVSIAVSGPPTITKVAYDVQAISAYTDMIQVMNYDFHVFNKKHNPFTGFNAPLHKMPSEFGILGQMNSEASMSTWIDLGLPMNKTFFGIPMYARGYQLATNYLHKPYSPATRALDQYTNYPMVCPLESDKNFEKVWNSAASSPYLYGITSVWVSYENSKSVSAKVNYAKSISVAGIMTFAIGTDDVNGSCGFGEFPLLNAISSAAN
ncbi:unnamed protein product [Caenorhabditis bovis]|uniref:GH18 domain-containing protein n=1 Tax=Caenorhabditis bovis TaxID=2654633 RepID=A0A8S1ELF3_9PELO|nr:unnamed protein product [Caenorhabditis bovis]